MAELNCPYYTVPGNHDIKGEGADYYRSRLATGDYFFDYAGYRFIFMDSALMTLSEAQLELSLIHIYTCRNLPQGRKGRCER